MSSSESPVEIVENITKSSESAVENGSKKIVLRSYDGELFEVEEAVAVESQTIKHMIEDDCAYTAIPVHNVTSVILSKVIEYCKRHVDAAASETDDKASSTPVSDDELKAFDADFVKVDQSTLFDLIMNLRMKFGKEFRIHLEKTLPEWRDKFLSYKQLKKLLKHYPPLVAVNLPQEPHPADPLPALQVWFVTVLYEELEKFNDFYVEKEEEFIIRFQALKERIERVKERARQDGLLSSETEFSEDTMEIRKDFVTIHGEMALLKSYSSLNFAGLIKILKKYDKRTGELLSLPFTQMAFHQPFFTTQPLTRLVCECEENLEILFPLEAEVLESNEERTIVAPTDITIASLDTAFSLGEKTVDIYRSTLAAISAIQGLKKASSTYNPLSMSYLFARHDSDNTGAVMDDNSPCNSICSNK